ncbi:MAG: PilZ domain-containing protein [Myxococcales bacterium]|nr:PilZ domain-containing protein [Myxococcales bacterium]
MSAYTRQTPRLAVRLSAELRHGEHTFTAVTRNLSIGGVCIESDVPLKEGDALSVGLFLVVDDVEDSTRPPLELQGRVAWVTPGEQGKAIMGVRFERLSAYQTTGLTKFLKMMGQT